MSSFFMRLAERATGKASMVHPLLSSRYSPGPEGQGNSEFGTESPMGATQPPTELSNSSPLGRAQPPDVSHVDGLQHNDQGRDNQSDPNPTDRNYFREPLVLDIPSIDLDGTPGIASSNNNQTVFGPNSTWESSLDDRQHKRDQPRPGEHSYARQSVVNEQVVFNPPVALSKPLNLPTERPLIPLVPTALAPNRVVAWNDVGDRDLHAEVPFRAALNRPNDPANPNRAIEASELVALHQDGPMPLPTTTRSNSAEQVQPVEPKAQFDRTTASSRMDFNRLEAESTAEPPVVRVTIGRIEVRAIMPAATPERSRTTRTQPVVSLDEYLKRGKGGQR